MSALAPPAWNDLHIRRCRGHFHIASAMAFGEEPIEDDMIEDVDLTSGLTFEAAASWMARAVGEGETP